MGRKTHKHETTSHYGRGRLATPSKHKGRKVFASMKREAAELDLDALAAEICKA